MERKLKNENNIHTDAHSGAHVHMNTQTRKHTNTHVGMPTRKACLLAVRPVVKIRKHGTHEKRKLYLILVSLSRPDVKLLQHNYLLKNLMMLLHGFKSKDTVTSHRETF